ncbi:MAG TPA: ferrochelatase, partial [Acidimicrobiales bacterium]|nr:ferrochelatase [Acidimicrobiales bacterium]
MSRPVAVLVMSYGSPASPAEIESYYTDIRRGRPPTAEQLADLVRRYEAIGGVSPLAERSAAQARAVAAALDEAAPGRFEVSVGTKHGRPRIEEAVEAVARRGASGIVGLVLAPHYSALSVGEYVERVANQADARGLPAAFVLSWHDEPELIELLADRLAAALGESSAACGPTVAVFTAHSLPERILAMGDPYPQQLAETAALVARRCGLDEAGIAWRVGWQSAGRTHEPWIGPDILDVLREQAAAGVARVVVCPAGFTADHLEVLYDLDIAACDLAR